MAGRQAHLNRFRTIPAPPAPAARLRPSAPLRRVHTTPQAAARPAAGCRGGTPAARARWSFRARATQDARIEASAPRDLAATDALCRSRAEHRAERRFDKSLRYRTNRNGLQTTRHPRKHRPGASSTRSCATSVTCRPAFLPPCLTDVIFGGVWGAAPTRRPGAERRAGGRVRWRSRMNPSSRGPPHPAQNRDFPAAWGCPKVGGGLIFNKAFLSGFHFVWE